MALARLDPLILDISSWQEMESSHTGSLADFQKAFTFLQAGDPNRRPGLIHKATQGTGYTDPYYAPRRPLAKAAGFLWGAYHFGDNSNISQQVDHFLAVAQPDDDTLLCLDWEPEPRGRSMWVGQAREFLTLLMERTGRPARGIKLYGGSVPREQLKTADDIAFFAQFPLWFCQYAPRATLVPKAWKTYTFWQFTGDGLGNLPHECPGIKVPRGKGLDFSVYSGTDMAREWGTARSMPPLDDSHLAAVDTTPPRVPIVQTAMTSRTVKVNATGGLFVAGGLLTTVLQKAGDWISSALDVIHEITPDVTDSLSSAQQVAGWFHFHWESISLGIAIAVICATLYRRFKPREETTA